MNTQILFPHIGKVIASTGSRHFPRMLHDLILTRLAVDATHITQLRVDCADHPAPRTYSSADDTRCVEVGTQLHLTRHKDDYRYVLSVSRSDESCSFSAQERLILEDFSPLLLPMVEKHINAIQPRSAARDDDASAMEGLDVLRQRFGERLSQSKLSLSNRELEVCVGLLAGRTAPELAEQLQLKPSTIESYLKRAAIKMGISGRHSLKRWMYCADDS
ncbi:LuxR C-terminal-related transcriptional regulator [Pseudomonas sp. N3-W]|uniref:LuxR C-terminal-related transcriptional regulator n=1 Tax=Pseudomonas fungipugnans TaxID=3024217 RepID=A0ABT6QJH0_9PSED|nr:MULTISPECIES: LuxR C-terminal-related transcriptional regulator [unclassified Pseudomonas]MDI2591027.1 LuxR C-terminal-related transcriptional regulator [Pseudomonas sp. 681]UWF47455.1 LuxR C-terminal-related transcriptional regulator [Pseudomonas sp. N3-W]